MVDKWAGIYEKTLNNKLEFRYAFWWIKQAVIREIEDNGYTIRITVHKIEQIY